MKKHLKKLLAASMSMALILNAGMAIPQLNSSAKESEEEPAQTYIVRTATESKINVLDKTYETGDTISDLSNDNMKDANFTTLELTKTEAEKLENDKKITMIERDAMIQGSSEGTGSVETPKGDNQQAEWNLQAVHCDETEKRETKENKVKVALIDSGVDLFNDIEVKEYINLIPGEENVMPLFWDTSGHGTSIAGIIAAQDNGEGITGINPNVELYSARVLDENKAAPISRIVEGIYWAIEKKVNIISLSFGTTTRSEALETAIKDAHKNGILIIAAAGNHGVVEYPATMDEVMAVGGTDTDGTACDYSARGEEVEIVAPAEKIKATGGFDGVVICNGTSMAVPHVVGVASKLWEKDLTKTADFIRQLMDVSANQYGEEQVYGNGLLDYEQALAVYDEFEENYKAGNTVEQNETAIEKNNSPIEKFTDVDYVNGSWYIDATKDPGKNSHETIASDALKQNGYATTGSGNATSANIIPAVKLGAVYPDKEDQNTEGMTKHPCFHGYFKTTGGNATCNYIYNYIKCTEFAHNLRNGASYSPPGICDPNNATQEFQRIFCSIPLGSLGNSAVSRSAFAYGVAIHTATDVFAHSVWTQEYGRLFHEIGPGKNNNFADDSSKCNSRFLAAKDVAKNILAHLKDNTIGTANDFCNSSYYNGQFKLYYFKEYLDGLKEYSLGNKMAAYSCR